jgi:hypothetical protein
MVSSFEAHLLAANRCGTVPLNRRGENVLQRQIGRFAQFAGGGWWKFVPAVHPLPRVFVLVVAVTKVTILSTLFSLKEEQDQYQREREVAGRVTFVTFFFLKLNLSFQDHQRREPQERAAFQHPSFQHP